MHACILPGCGLRNSPVNKSIGSSAIRTRSFAWSCRLSEFFLTMRTVHEENYPPSSVFTACDFFHLIGFNCFFCFVHFHVLPSILCRFLSCTKKWKMVLLWVYLPTVFYPHLYLQYAESVGKINKKPALLRAGLIWRRNRDLNPGTLLQVYKLSKPASSTT